MVGGGGLFCDTAASFFYDISSLGFSNKAALVTKKAMLSSSVTVGVCQSCGNKEPSGKQQETWWVSSAGNQTSFALPLKQSITLTVCCGPAPVNFSSPSVAPQDSQQDSCAWSLQSSHANVEGGGASHLLRTYLQRVKYPGFRGPLLENCDLQNRTLKI